MDSTAQTPPRDSEIIKELMSRVTQGFDIPNTPSGLRNHQRTAVTGDELLSRVTQGFDRPNTPYGLRNHQRTGVTGDARIRQPK
jgi:hypothetical protein